MSKAKDIIDERLAKGEITVEEHEALVKRLSPQQEEVTNSQPIIPSDEPPQIISEGMMLLGAAAAAPVLLIPFRIFLVDIYTNVMVNIFGLFMSPGERFFLPLVDRAGMKEDVFLGYLLPLFLIYSFVTLPIGKSIRSASIENSIKK